MALLSNSGRRSVHFGSKGETTAPASRSAEKYHRRRAVPHCTYSWNAQKLPYRGGLSGIWRTDRNNCSGGVGRQVIIVGRDKVISTEYTTSVLHGVMHVLTKNDTQCHTSIFKLSLFV